MPPLNALARALSGEPVAEKKDDSLERAFLLASLLNRDNRVPTPPVPGLPAVVPPAGAAAAAQAPLATNDNARAATISELRGTGVGGGISLPTGAGGTTTSTGGLSNALSLARALQGLTPTAPTAPSPEMQRVLDSILNASVPGADVVASLASQGITTLGELLAASPASLAPVLTGSLSAAGPTTFASTAEAIANLGLPASTPITPEILTAMTGPGGGFGATAPGAAAAPASSASSGATAGLFAAQAAAPLALGAFFLPMVLQGLNAQTKGIIQLENVDGRAVVSGAGGGDFGADDATLRLAQQYADALNARADAGETLPDVFGQITSGPGGSFINTEQQFSVPRGPADNFGPRTATAPVPSDINAAVDLLIRGFASTSAPGAALSEVQRPASIPTVPGEPNSLFTTGAVARALSGAGGPETALDPTAITTLQQRLFSALPEKRGGAGGG